MAEKLDLRNIRLKLDDLDDEMVKLFEERMSLSKDVADFKRVNNLATYDPSREQEVVDRATALVDNVLRGETTLFMRTLMALGREYQRALMFSSEPPAYLPEPEKRKGADVHCVYQGAPGAFGEQAAHRLFPEATFTNADYFEDVFRIVKSGEADYGVLPIENTQTGAIGETYDLLRRFGCFIVGKTWIDIRHCLLAKPGAAIRDIREVLSHPEGFRQCRRFLQDKPWDLIACSNTAVAAEKAAASEGNRTAAIGSRAAGEHTGLSVLADGIMDSDNNKTSFVVIAAHPEYDESSDLIALSFSTAHRSGSLCEALLPFMGAGINLTRIESRPSSSPQSYRFFAEINGNIMDRKVVETLQQVTNVTDYFEVIGCYKQV